MALLAKPNAFAFSERFNEALTTMSSHDDIARTLISRQFPLNAVVKFDGYYDVDDKGAILFGKDKDSTPQNMKAGKFLRRVFPTIKDYKSDADIEKFVNLLRSVTNNGEVTVTDDFSWAYTSDNYFAHRSTLGDSCMNNKTSIVEAYISSDREEHRQKIACVMQAGKITARAILWDNAEGYQSGNWTPFKIMDRIYSCQDKYIQTLVRWGIDNGYIIRDERSYDERESFYDTLEGFNTRRTMMLTSVRVSSRVFYSADSYPYTDTFHYDDEDYIYNNDDVACGPVRIYNSTGGYYEEHNSITAMCGNRFNEDDCRYSNYHDEYIHIDDAVYVSIGENQGWFRDCEVTYSSYYGEYVFDEDGREVDNGDFLLHEDIDETHDGREVHVDDIMFTDCDNQYKYCSEEVDEGYIVRATAGNVEDGYILEEESVRLHDDTICHEDDEYVTIGVGPEQGLMALQDDTVVDWQGNHALFDDVESYPSLSEKCTPEERIYVHHEQEDEYIEAVELYEVED